MTHNSKNIAAAVKALEKIVQNRTSYAAYGHHCDYRRWMQSMQDIAKEALAALAAQEGPQDESKSANSGPSGQSGPPDVKENAIPEAVTAGRDRHQSKPAHEADAVRSVVPPMSSIAENRARQPMTRGDLAFRLDEIVAQRFVCLPSDRDDILATFDALEHERHLNRDVLEQVKLALRQPGVAGSYVEWARVCRAAIDEADQLRRELEELRGKVEEERRAHQLVGDALIGAGIDSPDGTTVSLARHAAEMFVHLRAAYERTAAHALNAQKQRDEAVRLLEERAPHGAFDREDWDKDVRDFLATLKGERGG